MKRVFTGTVLIALVFTLIYFEISWLVSLVSTAIALLAALEFRGLAAKASSPIPLWWTALTITVLFTIAALHLRDPVAPLPALPLLAVALLALILFTANAFRSPLQQVLGSTGAGLLLMLYVAWPLTLVPQILAAEDGTALLLFLFLCVWCGDIAALYIGRAFGRRKLAPTLSPNKTWAGALASVLGSLLFGVALVLLGDWFSFHNSSFTRLHTGWPLWQFALLALALNLAAQLGDLVESALKRSVGVKDSGTLLPGHGGILDRIDALLFAAPVLWLVLVLHASI